VPAHWILKTEPSAYAFADLRREGTARWDGITNAQALIHLRAMTKGDLVLVYHSGTEKALVGRGTLARAAYPDPAARDPKRVAVDVRAGEPLPQRVTLAAIKADPAFRELGLVRNSRLSVVPVPPELFDRLLALAGVP
jgi:predicted RNA-binding protein with PUA-like domain